MYVDYPSKMKIGAFMSRNGIPTYSEFLRMATFFLINKGYKSTETVDNWKIKRSKKEILTNPKNKIQLEVMTELKELFKKGNKILKKIE